MENEIRAKLDEVFTKFDNRLRNLFKIGNDYGTSRCSFRQKAIQEIFDILSGKIGKEGEGLSEGKIKWFSNIKRYGFITADNGRDIFVQKKDIPLVEQLNGGERVRFKISNDKNGEIAKEVEIIAQKIGEEKEKNTKDIEELDMSGQIFYDKWDVRNKINELIKAVNQLKREGK